ncbi:MAG: porin family protein [Spirochaetaceae bacterium]|nr:porin family protein [Spirochaetaceae bacterium]
MKKVVVMLLCMTVCGATVFAQSGLFSVGGGAILAPNFRIMKYKGGVENNSSSFGGGFNLFFDATYAEANISFLFANEKAEGADKGTDTTNLLIGIVGKYPLALGEQFSVFPFAGIDYRIVLGASYDGNKIEDSDAIDVIAEGLNALSLIFGVGVDYSLTSALYFRGEIGFGITFNSKFEDDMKDFIDSNFKGKIPIKLAVGYRF